ncbi:MAG: hypothetical protein OMOMHJEC_02930 [Xanthomonadales bacterium]|nr:hypothetical protein [Xanthomonadales bacterium]
MHLFGGELGVDEDDRARRLHARQQADQQRQLLVAGREVDALGDARGGHRIGLHLERQRLVHVFVGELQHAVRERRREQQALALAGRRHLAQDVADVLDEAEVEHAVGLVEHHHLDRAQAEHVLLEVVHQPARSADQHVDALGELRALLVVVDAAVDQAETQPGEAAELQRVLVDLDREFAGGREDHRTRVLDAAFGHRLMGQQALHQGHEEGGGLAGAGLRLAGDVAVLQRFGQGERLDRGQAGEAGLGEAGGQRGVQPEAVEIKVGQGTVGHPTIHVVTPPPGARRAPLAYGNVRKSPAPASPGNPFLSTPCAHPPGRRAAPGSNLTG